MAYTFTTLDFPDPSLSYGKITGDFLTGINNAGQIVGYYTTQDSPVVAEAGSDAVAPATNSGIVTRFGYGFLISAGSFSNLADPDNPNGADETVPLGINNAGQIVGSSTRAGGFLYNGSSYVELAEYPYGINDAGEIVGSFGIDIGGTYTALDDPSSYGNSTVANGINDAGQIVGDYQDINGNTHGFLYS